MTQMITSTRNQDGRFKMLQLEKIPIFDMSLKLEKHSVAIHTAIDRVISSGNLVLGQFVESFESNFAKYLGINHCYGVGNGTDALEIALRSLGCEANTLVGITANAGGYSRIAIDSVGYSALYADVEEQSMCLSLEGCRKLIDSGARIIILTHLYGRVAPEAQEISKLCKASGVWLIEDCAQAHGAFLGKTKAGRFGDVATFSFYPTKNLGSVGDAGCVVTDIDDIATRVNMLRTYGWGDKYEVKIRNGRNSRMDALQASILDELLPHLDEENFERRRVAHKIFNGLKSDSIKIENADDPGCNFHLLIVKTNFRSELQNHLNNLGIGTAIHYPIPDHRQLGWTNHSEQQLPITENVCSQVLSIPCYPGMNSQQVERVMAALNNFKPKNY